jgi:hypothetical protein
VTCAGKKRVATARPPAPGTDATGGAPNRKDNYVTSATRFPHLLRHKKHKHTNSQAGRSLQCNISDETELKTIVLHSATRNIRLRVQSKRLDAGTNGVRERFMYEYTPIAIIQSPLINQQANKGYIASNFNL